MKRIVRVGTRESRLAVAQSNWVIDRIREKYPDMSFELVGIKTMGDKILDKRLDKIGGKGLFIKELENALLEGEIDMAVHSMKDMPGDLPKGLMIAAVSKREDPRDVLITADKTGMGDLKKGAVIGTSSLRREVQILDLNPGFNIKTLRGNVITRLEKLKRREYDAIILAAAGLKRLGMEGSITEFFGTDRMIPAVGQGALGIETRSDEDIEFLLNSIHNEESALAVTAERGFMKRLGGNCSTPIAAHGVIEGDKIKLWGMLADEDKSNMAKAYIEGGKNDPESLGIKLAGMILEGRAN